MLARLSKNVFTSIFVLLALLFLFRTALLVAMGKWLVAQTPVEEVDLVVALGGEQSRQDAAVRYLNQGLAQRVLFFRSDRPEAYRLLKLPDGDAFRLIESARTTYEEALIVRKLFRDQSFRSVLVVTSAHHLRRARLAFERVFRNTGVHLMFAAAPKGGFPMESWWKNEASRQAVFKEYAALAFYWATVW